MRRRRRLRQAEPIAELEAQLDEIQAKMGAYITKAGMRTRELLETLSEFDPDNPDSQLLDEVALKELQRAASFLDSTFMDPSLMLLVDGAEDIYDQLVSIEGGGWRNP